MSELIGEHCLLEIKGKKGGGGKRGTGGIGKRWRKYQLAALGPITLLHFMPRLNYINKTSVFYLESLHGDEYFPGNVVNK